MPEATTAAAVRAATTKVNALAAVFVEVPFDSGVVVVPIVGLALVEHDKTRGDRLVLRAGRPIG